MKLRHMLHVAAPAPTRLGLGPGSRPIPMAHWDLPVPLRRGSVTNPTITLVFQNAWNKRQIGCALRSIVLSDFIPLSHMLNMPLLYVLTQ